MKTTGNKIETQVMTKVKSGQIKMRPKIYYVLTTVLSAALVAVLATLLSYSISLASLWLRLQSAAGPAYGAHRNLTSLVNSFPWWAVLLSVVALAGLVIFVKKQGSFYRIRLVYLITAIVLLATAVGYGLSYTNLPNTLKQQHGQNACQVSDVSCQTGQGKQRGQN
jgi:hypothetical protein